MVNEKLTGKTIDELVEEQMKPENIKVEVKNENNKWEEIGNKGE